MTAKLALTAETRENIGKGAARQLRREGKVPAIIYGGKGKEVNISLSKKELVKELNKGNFTSRIIELDLAGEKIMALPRDIHFHPVSDEPEHADFQRVSKGERIRVWVKVVLSGKEKSPGIRKGGILNLVRHRVELYCSSDNIPEAIQGDVGNLNIGGSLHIKDVKLPEGVETVIRGRNFTIATIVGRTEEEDLSAPVVATAVVPSEHGGEPAAEGAAPGAAAPAGDAKAAAPAAEKDSKKK